MGQRLALIVGNTVYHDSTLSKLEAPEVDVGALADVLMDQDIGGFDDVKMVVNMSSPSIRRAISEFYARKRRDDLLLLYFSGHGVLDELGRLYLGLKDTDSRLLRGTSIPATFITDEMDNSHSQRQVLILDCCHSGAFARGTKGSPGARVGTATTFEGTGFGRVVLTASDATQYAFEGNQVIGEAQTSLFTYFLVEGMQSGRADTNHDGQITVDELYDFIYEQIVTRTPHQTPGKWSYKMRGELILAATPVPAGPLEPKPIEASADMDDTLAAELDRRYTRGLSAFWLREWDKAIRHFQEIVRLQPAYLDAAGKLEEAKGKKQIDELYEQAQDAAGQEAWDQVIVSLESLMENDPNHKEARRLIEKATKRKQINDLYLEAAKLAESEHWRAVLNVVERILQLDPEFEDVQELAARAQQMAQIQERDEHLGDLYGRAVRALDSGNSELTRRLLQEVIEIQPDFEEAARLLARVDAELEGAGQSTAGQAPETSSLDERQSDRAEFPGRVAVMWGAVEEAGSRLWSRIAQMRAKNPLAQEAEGTRGRPGMSSASQSAATQADRNWFDASGRQVFYFWLAANLLSWFLGTLLPFFPGPWIENLVYELGLGDEWIWISIAAMFGLLLGTAQWIVLRRLFDPIWPWVPATALGLFTGQLLFDPISHTLSEIWGWDYNVSILIADTARITIAAVFQYTILRSRLRGALLWIPVAAAGGFIGYVVQSYTLDFVINAIGWDLDPAIFLGSLLIGASLGLASGLTLVLLRSRSSNAIQGA